jgi:hypothetical protein
MKPLSIIGTFLACVLLFGFQQKPSSAQQKPGSKAASSSGQNADTTKGPRGTASPGQPATDSTDNNAVAPPVPRQNDKVEVTALPPEIAVKQVKDSIDRTVMCCTIILTIVGVVGTIAAVRTLRQVKRQADTLEDHKTKFDELAKAANSNAEAAILQVRAMQEQIFEMSVQSGILQESVQVARDAAEAAKQNTEMFISKERARLRVEMKPLVLPSESNAPYDTVDFTVSAYGQTDAFVTDSLCVAGVGPQEFINYPELWDRVMFPIHSLPSVVVADSAPRECSALIGKSGHSGDDLLIQEVKAGRLFVCVRGFVKYKDVFDRERETAFRYVWRYSQAVADYGQWEKCGRPEENRGT